MATKSLNFPLEEEVKLRKIIYDAYVNIVCSPTVKKEYVGKPIEIKIISREGVVYFTINNIE